MLTADEARAARAAQTPLTYRRERGMSHNVTVIAVAEFGTDGYAVRIKSDDGSTLWVNEGADINPRPRQCH